MLVRLEGELANMTVEGRQKVENYLNQQFNKGESKT